MGYVDLHSHLLPGLDDGAQTVADTLDFARRLDADGVRDIACTPHVKRASFPGVAPAALAERRAAVQAEIDAAGLDVQLHPGGELAHPDALFLAPEQLALLAQGPEDARWMLLECPFRGIGADFLAAAARLDGLGYGLLLAHPERAAGMMCGGLDRLQPLLANGALLQVNVSSLLGRHGAEAQAIGATLVRRGLAYCLASDAHPGTREDTLRAGSLALLRTGADSSRAVELTDTNPRRLLEHGISRPAPAAAAALLRAA